MVMANYGSEGSAAGTTGRYLVLFREADGVQAGVSALSDTAGLSAMSTVDFDENAVPGEQLEESEAVVFDKLGVAVVDADPDQLQSFRAATTQEESPILAVEPERVVYALPAVQPPGQTYVSTPAGPATGLSADWWQGYQDAVNHLASVAGGSRPSRGGIAEKVSAARFDESLFTWGLQATLAATSKYSGKGVKITILDTGFDMQHPDFQGRMVHSRSFIKGEEVQDGNGHGTHCIGTACGPEQPGQSPRYGVAYDSEIFAGKVLSNQGSGNDGGILAGIDWAITNRCNIISMSLGAPVVAGQGFPQVYEEVARRSFAAGTIIVAAAGNESRRPGHIAPVGHPANCPSIMAVAALDQEFQVARFSCGSVNHPGGGVDIGAPGVAVRSSWSATAHEMPGSYRLINGTSMATPHVAGIAALHAEANPGVRGRALAQRLFESARRLELLSTDVGVGLVQAP